jgi:DNA processing protein
MRSSFPDRSDAFGGLDGHTRAILAARALPGVGDIAIKRVVEEGGDLASLMSSHPESARQRAFDTVDETCAALDRLNAYVLTLRDERYPERLRELHDAPAVLYARGALDTATAPAVAIVGTRAASSYGLRVARAIATRCARAGIAVISGLAKGVDGAAHEAALAAGGRTVGVLGTGLDITYPRSHRALQERIAVEGLLLSELPPGIAGHGGTFPRRNRLIAALADVTIVVEAGVGSGALITAEVALSLHRRVACVPNAIDVPSAAGSNALLKAHAEPILAPDDVLTMFQLQAQPTPRPLLDGDAALCWDAVQRGADDISAIRRLAGLPLRSAASALSALELEGLVHVEATGRIRSSLATPVAGASAQASL